MTSSYFILPQNSLDNDAQKAYGYALGFADKDKDDVRAGLEMAKQSRVDAIRKRAEAVLERRW
jgi:hypothetical protein